MQQTQDTLMRLDDFGRPHRTQNSGLRHLVRWAQTPQALHPIVWRRDIVFARTREFS